MLLVRRTRATLRSAEFGFFGVVVYTRVHTPRRCGLPLSAAVLTLAALSRRPLRTSWLMVGIYRLSTCFRLLVQATLAVLKLGIHRLGQGSCCPAPVPHVHTRSGVSRTPTQATGCSFLQNSTERAHGNTSHRHTDRSGHAGHDPQQYPAARQKVKIV